MNRALRRAAERAARRPPPPRRPRMPPAGLVRMHQDTLDKLLVGHTLQVNAIANGTADVHTVWSWAVGCLGWSYVAQHYGAGEVEMKQQLEAVFGVLRRLAATGRIGFTGEELTVSRQGVHWMEDLAQITDYFVACEAMDKAAVLAAEMRRKAG